MKIINLRAKIKRSKFFYFNYLKLTSNDYKMGYKEYLLNCTKSKEIVKRELDLISSYWNCDPMHYYRYRLYSKKLSDEQLLDFIPPYYFYNIYMCNILKNIDVSSYMSKVFLNELFLKKEIKTPSVIAIIKNRIFHNSNMDKISFNGFTEVLKNSLSSRFFLKPEFGSGGKGIIVLDKIDGILFISGKRVSNKYLNELLLEKVYILQEGLLQHKDIAIINSTSVNTLRVITQNDGINIKIPAAAIRIGRNSSNVDNATQGGISVCIDVHTGILNKFGYLEHGNQIFEQHPDSGFVFKGYVLKDWEKIKMIIKNNASKVSELKEIGWDIAIGQDQIYAIELNVGYGIDHLQCTCGGMRTKLGVNI